MSQPAAPADTPLIEKSPPVKTGAGRQAMRLMYFILAFVAVDRAIYFSTIYFAGHIRGNRLIVRDAHNDLVVVGASHSKDAIYPNVFRDMLGFETINLSISGLETSDYAALLERYLRHNPAPKAVLFDGTAWLYAQTALPESQEKNQSNRYRYFLPFTGIDADYDRLVQPSLPPETWILGKVITTYTLNNQLDMIFNDGYRHHTLSRRSDGYLGQNILHDGLAAAQEKNWAYRFPNGYRLKTSSKMDLENVIGICERYKTKIFFVNFPVDARLDRIERRLGAGPLRDDLRRLIEPYPNARYLDYSQAMLAEPEGFCNLNHLNYAGAERFTKRLASDLKPLLASPGAARRGFLQTSTGGNFQR